MTHVSVRALGVDVTLAVDLRIADAVRRAWAGCVIAPPASGEPMPAEIHVCLDSCGDVHGANLEELLHHLSPTVTQRAIDSRAGDLVMLHAAALADPDTGATAVLVAPSGTGKTTAAATLGRELAYLTDETAGITGEGLVLPYRKPLSIIESGHLKAQRSPQELGLVTTDRDCHVAGVLVIERRADHVGDPFVSALDTVDALAALAPEASYLGRLDHPLQRLADVVRRAGGARRVTYSEAASLTPLVRAMLDRAR